MMPKKGVPEIIRGASRQDRHFQISTNNVDNTTIEWGQVWSTYSRFQIRGKTFETNEPRLVVIVRVADDDTVTVVPISMRLGMATDFDLIIPAHENTLGLQFMIEVWNETSAQQSQLRQRVGTLSQNASSLLRQLYRIRILGEPMPDTVQGWIGLPLFGEDDARHVFQEQEIEALEYLSKPTLALMIEDELEAAQPVWSFTFDLKPLFDKLSNFLNPQVAYASGISGEAPTVLLTDEQHRFVFEILHRKRQAPYMVYLRVVALSRELENRRSRITVDYEGREIRSELVELHLEQSIQLSEDRQFDTQRITNVRIEIE